MDRVVLWDRIPRRRFPSFTSLRMTARTGKTRPAASVVGCIEASAQPLRPPRSGRVLRVVEAVPLARLIAQVLLLAVLGGTVGLSVTGWAIGLICGVIM